MNGCLESKLLIRDIFLIPCVFAFFIVILSWTLSSFLFFLGFFCWLFYSLIGFFVTSVFCRILWFQRFLLTSYLRRFLGMSVIWILTLVTTIVLPIIFTFATDIIENHTVRSLGSSGLFALLGTVFIAAFYMVGSGGATAYRLWRTRHQSP